jgi:putative intracellular protease/amidase
VSLKDVNPVNAKTPKRVAIVLASPAVSPSTKTPVGFWWSELTHPYYAFREKGYTVEVFSYDGGKAEADAMSDPDDPTGYSAGDLITQGFKHTPSLMALLDDTRPVTAIAVEDFDAILIAGGQAPMATMQDQTALHALFSAFYEAGKIACCLCHGSSVLRYAKLSTGDYLCKGKTVTGFANVEEDFGDNAVWDLGYLPRGVHLMPWRIEDELRALGANYVQGGLWRGFAVRDGNLITGQQNFSGAETAELMIRALGE